MDNRYTGNHIIRGVDIDYTIQNIPSTDTLDWLALGYGRNRVNIYELPKKVIYNKRATILVWNNNTKTVVKAKRGEPVDKMLGFLIAYFQQNSGLSKTQANKYLEQLIDKEPKMLACSNCFYEDLSPLTSICSNCGKELLNWRAK